MRGRSYKSSIMSYAPPQDSETARLQPLLLRGARRQKCQPRAQQVAANIPTFLNSRTTCRTLGDSQRSPSTPWTAAGRLLLMFHSRSTRKNGHVLLPDVMPPFFLCTVYFAQLSGERIAQMRHAPEGYLPTSREQHPPRPLPCPADRCAAPTGTVARESARPPSGLDVARQPHQQPRDLGGAHPSW